MGLYLDRIAKLNGKYYEWNEKMEQLTGITGNAYGVIAQEVQKEFPEMVGMEDGYLTVDYKQLIPVMIESIKELKSELDFTKSLVEKKVMPNMDNEFGAIAPRSMYKEHLFFANKIVIKRSQIHRWGIFAREKIKKYEIIEESPYFVIPHDEINLCPSCLPYSYDLYDNFIMGMGNSGLYNHSINPNVEFQVDRVNEIMRHYSIRDIDAGEELTLNYGEENAKNFMVENSDKE